MVVYISVIGPYLCPKLDSVHFLNVHLNKFDADLDLPITLMVVSRHDVASSTLIALQNFQNLSEIKFVPPSDINLWGIPYSARILF